MIFYTILSVFTILVLSVSYTSFVVINEGNVGVVYNLGSLSENILNPGFHFKLPLLTQVHQVQVTVQTDYVRDIPCGTNSGVTIMFDKIEVVNQLDKSHVYETVKNYTVDYDRSLIFDKVAHEMNQFCSKHSLQEVYIDEFDKLYEMLMETLQKSLNLYSPGVTIRNVRLSKPTVPVEVANNYKKIVEYQTEMLRANTQQQKDLQSIKTENEKALSRLQSDKDQTLAKIKSEQEKKLAEIESNKNYILAQTRASHEKDMAQIEADETRNLAEITMQIIINNKTLEKEMEYKRGYLDVSKVENEIAKQKRFSEVDIDNYRDMKHAEYSAKLLTPGYVAIEMAKSISTNSKIYYGNSLPQFFSGFGYGMMNTTSLL